MKTWDYLKERSFCIFTQICQFLLIRIRKELRLNILIAYLYDHIHYSFEHYLKHIRAEQVLDMLITAIFTLNLFFQNRPENYIQMISLLSFIFFLVFFSRK